jgi:hypothetical protein
MRYIRISKRQYLDGNYHFAPLNFGFVLARNLPAHNLPPSLQYVLGGPKRMLAVEIGKQQPCPG